jgi:hypothetical protein
MRGYHLCDLCGATKPIKFKVDGGEVVLGDAEMHISQGAKVFAAPNLLVHYIVTHEYQPPEEFVKAVLGRE